MLVQYYNINESNCDNDILKSSTNMYCNLVKSLVHGPQSELNWSPYSATRHGSRISKGPCEISISIQRSFTEESQGLETLFGNPWFKTIAIVVMALKWFYVIPVSIGRLWVCGLVIPRVKRLMMLKRIHTVLFFLYTADSAFKHCLWWKTGFGTCLFIERHHCSNPQNGDTRSELKAWSD